jgi:divalent metal cation (Fe/Co/Zn/Cd) transporter
MWGPLATGIAVVLSHSTTQLADFVRRSVELMALLISWLVFRQGIRRRELSPRAKARLEKIANLSVTAALACSGLVILGLALARINSFVPGGNVTLGLAIAALGLTTNLWFWRRYYKLTQEQASPIIAAQIRLYRGKALVDLCVLVALAAVAIDPAHFLTHYIDIVATVAVAVYLLWSAVRGQAGKSSYKQHDFSN